MRVFKLIVAILTVILAFAGFALAVAVALLAFNVSPIAAEVTKIIGSQLDGVTKPITDLIGTSVNPLYIVFGAVAFFSLILLILGIRFCNKKPTRFTGFILWIFYTAAAVGLLYLGYPTTDWIYLGAAIFAGVMSFLIVFVLATVKLRGGKTKEDKEPKEKKEKKEKEKKQKDEPQEKAAPAPAAQPAPAPAAAPQPQAVERVAVTTESPNFAAKIIRDNLRYETIVSGDDVIVSTSSSNAQQIADELSKNGIKVSRMRKV